MPENPIYDFMKANRLTNKDEATFLKEYADSAKAKELYSFFQANKLTDKNFDTFYGTYLKKKVSIADVGMAARGGGEVGVSKAPSGLTVTGYETDLDRSIQERQRQATQINFDENDPIKSSLLPIENKIAERRNRQVSSSTATPVSRLSESFANKELASEKRFIENKRFRDVKEAELFLFDKLDKSKLVPKQPLDITKEPTLDDFTEESVVEASPKDNLTVQKAASQYFTNKEIKEDIGSSASLDEAAIKNAIRKGDVTSKQITELGGDIPNQMKGLLVLNFLNNPDVREEANKNPELMNQVRQELFDLPEKYPLAAIRMMAEMVSKEMEQRGDNNAILNIKSKNSTDDIVNELVERGDLPVQYKYLYDNPAVKLAVNSSLKTSGFVENLLSGAEQGLMGIGKTVAEVTGLRSAYSDKNERTFKALEKQYSDFAFKPKGWIHEISTHGGLVTGQVSSMMAGGGLIKAAGLVNSTKAANAIMAGLQTFGENKDRALVDLPGESGAKQLGYATVLTGVEIALANVLDDTKLAKSLIKGVSPEIKTVVTKFANKEITAAAAKKSVIDLFSNALSKSGTFVKGTVSVAKKEAWEEAVTEILQATTNQVFSGQPIELSQSAEDAFEVWRTTFLGSLFLGIGGGVVDVNKNPSMPKLIYEMAENPDKYIEIIEGQAAIDENYSKDVKQKIANLEYISKVKQDLDGTEMSKRDKEKFLLASLNQKILSDQAESITEPTLKKKPEEKIKELEAVKQDILENPTKEEQPTIDQDRVLGDEEKDQELLTTLQELAGEGVNDQDLQFFIDQAANAPNQFVETYGEQITQELLNKATVEQVQKGLEDAKKFDNNPNVALLEKELEKRNVNNKDVKLTPEQKILQQAIDNNEVGAIYLDIVKASVNDPKEAKLLLDNAKSQIEGQVAGNIGTAREGVEKAFGKSIVDFVLPKAEAGSVGVGGDGFKQAGEKARDTKDATHIGRWMLDNSQKGDVVRFQDGGYEVTEVNTKKDGTKELVLTPFEFNEDGSKDYNNSGIKIITEQSIKNGSNLFENAYTNSKGERVIEQSTYEPVEQSLKETPKAEAPTPKPKEQTPVSETPKTQAKELADKVRKLKIDLSKLSDGGLQSNPLGLPVAVWNGAMDIVAKTIEAGGQVADAIKRGLNYIQKNHRGQWDKKGFNDQVMKELGVRGITVNGQDLIIKSDAKTEREFAETVNGWYSDLEQSVLDIKGEKGSGENWKKVLANSDEAKWTGLNEWLSQQKGQVSKKDIQDYLKENRVQIVEVVKGNDEKAFTDKKIKDAVYTDSKEWVELGNGIKTKADIGGFVWLDMNGIKERLPYTQAENYIHEGLKTTHTETKFGQYQLEGEKENYKEVLVTMPSKKANYDKIENDFGLNDLANKMYGKDLKRLDHSQIEEVRFKLFSDNPEKSKKYDEVLKNAREQEGDKFKSSHFDEPNILVHLRMNTRKDAEGKKVLFLEEIQSDWGQKGKKEGFAINANTFDKNKLEIKDLNDDQVEIFYNGQRIGVTNGDSKSVREDILDSKSRQDKILSKIGDGGTPQAPFVTETPSWTKLGLKVALKEAVKQGADKIAWTTGEQQNDRYDLSKQVKHIDYKKNDDGTYWISVKGLGEETLYNEWKETPEKIEATLGKDVARKIVEGEGNYRKEYNSAIGSDEFDRAIPTTRLEGENLKVGGKGMKGFYGSPSEGKLGIVGEVAKSLFKQEPKTTTLQGEKPITTDNTTVERGTKSYVLKNENGDSLATMSFETGVCSFGLGVGASALGVSLRDCSTGS